MPVKCPLPYNLQRLQPNGAGRQEAVGGPQPTRGQAGSPCAGPLRVLHVIGAMKREGAQTWLMTVLRGIDRERFRFDFLVHSSQPAAYDDEIVAMGSRIIPCPYSERYLRYAREFRRILRQEGPYEVVHTHVHHFSGYVLQLAAKENVPVRIAHCHNTSDSKQDTFSRRMYRRKMKRSIRSYATAGIAASREAAEALFGPGWQGDARWRVIHYGIDLPRFTKRVDSQPMRRSLGIPPRGQVVGHVGRFDEQKNHVFFVEVAREVARQLPNTWFVLVGDGPLRPDIQALVRARGVEDRFIFTGTRPDVAQLMLGAMDVFVFPSLYEGLGLVLIEAQAAGLACVTSDGVPEEAIVIPELVWRLPLEVRIAEWAQAVITCLASAPYDKQLAVQKVAESDFNIERTLPRLASIYMQGRDSPP
jgi:glycosyltransferase involved in cell wall biosynthesis